MDRSGLTPLPVDEFAPASDEQLALRAAADEALGAGDEDTALTALLALARSRPRSETAAIGTVLLAQLYHRRGDVQRSLEVLDELIAWSPPSADLEYIHASTLLDLDRAPDAADALTRAIRVDPDHIRAYPMLVAVLESLGRSEAADEALLAMERRVRRLGRELDGDASSERKLQVLSRLRVGFPHADIARAAAAGLDDDDPEVVAAALQTLERVGTVDVLDPIRAVAAGTGANAERAASLAAALRGEAP